MNPQEENAAVLEEELDWFGRFLDARVRLHLGDGQNTKLQAPDPPDLAQRSSFYADFVAHYDLIPEERLILMLAIAPHLRPHALDPLLRCREESTRGYTEFGGVRSRHHSGFLPTIETALFLLAGTDVRRRLECMVLFEEGHFFQQHDILLLDGAEDSEPATSDQLRISPDVLHYLLRGRAAEPRFGPEFPARRIETGLDWDYLVLDPYTHEQLSELRAWLQHGDRMLKEWQFAEKLAPGYRCLFHGPPGTGKTLTASLLGKTTDRPVYRIDLSLIVSKYVGETARNLEKVFRQAERRRWILFFDEADALFGKRTTISDAHDRYANQEIAYLLQRIEAFPGVVILATNMKTNIDEAFARRFQSIVHFPMPGPDERRQLWRQGFSPATELEDGIDLVDIAETHELSGGSIMNVIRYCSLMAMRRDSTTITAADLNAGIQREFAKEGRTSR